MAQINFELKELKTDTDLETLIRGIVNLSFDKDIQSNWDMYISLPSTKDYWVKAEFELV